MGSFSGFTLYYVGLTVPMSNSDVLEAMSWSVKPESPHNVPPMIISSVYSQM